MWLINLKHQNYNDEQNISIIQSNLCLFYFFKWSIPSKLFLEYEVLIQVTELYILKVKQCMYFGVDIPVREVEVCVTIILA